MFGTEQIACTASDLSPEGVRVGVDGSVRLPPEVLFIDVWAGLAYATRVSWTSRGKRTEAGLAFTDVVDLDGGVPGGPLRKAWLSHVTPGSPRERAVPSISA